MKNRIIEEIGSVDGTFFKDFDISWTNTFRFLRIYFELISSRYERITFEDLGDEILLNITRDPKDGDISEDEWRAQWDTRINTIRAGFKQITVNHYLCFIQTFVNSPLQRYSNMQATYDGAVVLEKKLINFMINRIQELESQLSLNHIPELRNRVNDDR